MAMLIKYYLCVNDSLSAFRDPLMLDDDRNASNTYAHPTDPSTSTWKSPESRIGGSGPATEVLG